MIAISAGQDHSLALKADGRLISWGGRSGKTQYNESSTIPNLSSISAGGFHSLQALCPRKPIQITMESPIGGNSNSLDPSAAIDPGIDSDHDGLTDHQEYLTGTDPWDNKSYFRSSIGTQSRYRHTGNGIRTRFHRTALYPRIRFGFLQELLARRIRHGGCANAEQQRTRPSRHFRG